MRTSCAVVVSKRSFVPAMSSVTWTGASSALDVVYGRIIPEPNTPASTTTKTQVPATSFQ